MLLTLQTALSETELEMIVFVVVVDFLSVYGTLC